MVYASAQAAQACVHLDGTRDPDTRRVGIIRPWLVTDDRERDWPPIRDAERYKARIYAAWLRDRFGPRD